MRLLAARRLIGNSSSREPQTTKVLAMGPPKPPVPHVAPIYRLTATALGAGMWFWVRLSPAEPSTPKASCPNPQGKGTVMLTCCSAADVQSQEGRYEEYPSPPLPPLAAIARAPVLPSTSC